MQGCLFLAFVHLGGPKSPKPQFWSINRLFQTKRAKSKNVHIIKTSASIPTKYCTVIKTTKWPSQVVPTHALQIKDGGRPPSWKKSKHCYISYAHNSKQHAIPAADISNFKKSEMADGRHLDEIWHAGAVRLYLTVLFVKVQNFRKSKLVAANILRNPKSRYRDNGLTYRHEIWHGVAIRHL